MSNDLLMLRGDPKDGFNLAVGEPAFLQWYTGFAGYRQLMAIDTRYPPYGGDALLIERIRATNPNVKKHVIVTVGAKHALSAAFYAFHERRTWPVRTAILPRPYWPSYPTLLKLAGYSVVSPENSLPSDLTIVTSPNNPDGAETIGDFDVWDAAYFHRTLYGATAVPNAKVSVWSMAKLYGLSGVRLGYATTDDDELAELMRKYVEITTSGVANDSQQRVAQLLELSPEVVAADHAQARVQLLKNGQIFNQYLGSYYVEARGVPVDGRGMFAWVRFPDADRVKRALAASKVTAIPGTACGASDAWWRFSMGHKPSYTEAACDALERALR
jgi:aspartate/methionine/tyrosine aminotransferase